MWVQHHVTQGASVPPNSSSWEHVYFAKVQAQDKQRLTIGIASISSCCTFPCYIPGQPTPLTTGVQQILTDPPAAEEAPPSLPSLVSEGRF